MDLLCARTAALHVRSAPASEAPVWLNFLESGLLVELRGAAERLHEAPDGRQLELDRTEALGLGLTPNDFDGGVALCLDESGEFGWRCESVTLSVRDFDGALRRVSTSSEAARWLP